MHNPMNMENQEALVKIRSLKDSLRPAEWEIAGSSWLIRRITTMTITDLAQLGNCSETTITRMAKALGYRGFGELKLAIATELPLQGTNLYETIQPDDSLYAIAGHFFYRCVQSFNDTLKYLNPESLEQAVDILLKSSRVGCFGVGASGIVAKDAETAASMCPWSFVDPTSRSHLPTASLRTMRRSHFLLRQGCSGIHVCGGLTMPRSSPL